MKGVSFAIQVLIVVVVIMIVALVVLSIFGGGIQGVANFITSLTGGEAQPDCTSIPGGSCVVGSCTPPAQLNLGGKCPTGQICCVTPQGQ